MLEPRSRGGGGGGKSSGDGKIGTGRETLRLRSKGPATVEEMVTVFSQCIFHYSGFCLALLTHFFTILKRKVIILRYKLSIARKIQELCNKYSIQNKK